MSDVKTDEAVEYACDRDGGTVTIRVETLDDEGFNRKRHIEEEIEVPPESVLFIQTSSREVEMEPNNVSGNPRVEERR